MEKADFFVSGESLMSPGSVRSEKMRFLARLGLSGGFRSRVLSGSAILAVLAACDSSDSSGVAAATMDDDMDDDPDSTPGSNTPATPTPAPGSNTPAAQTPTPTPGILTYTRPDGTVIVQNFNESRAEDVTTSTTDDNGNVTVTVTMFIQDTDFVLLENADVSEVQGMAPGDDSGMATSLNDFLSTTLTGTDVTYEVESVMIGLETLRDVHGNARLPDGLSLNDDGELEGTVTDDSQVGSVYNIVIRARDGDGITTATNQAFSFKLRVDNVNDDPVLRVNNDVDAMGMAVAVTASLDDQNAAIGGRFIPVEDIFKDDDGDTLAFSAASMGGDIATFSSAPGGLVFGATTDAQIAAASAVSGMDDEPVLQTVVVTADDGNGGTATVTFMLGGGLDFWAGSPTLAPGYGFVIQNSAGGAPLFAAPTGPDDAGMDAAMGAQEQDLAAIPFGAAAVLGHELRPAGDLNNDGVLDFLVSAPLATDPSATDNAVAHGAVYVVYGKPNPAMAGLEGTQFGETRNFSIQLGGDDGPSLQIDGMTVDLEGRALELVIGGQTVDFSDASSLSADQIRLLTGGNAEISIRSTQQVLDLGSLAAADGVAFYGANSYGPSDAPTAGMAATLDNLTAARADLATAAYNTSFYGFSVRAADLDGDGIGDLAVGSPRSGDAAPALPASSTATIAVDERYGYFGQVFITRGSAMGFEATISDDDQIAIDGDVGRVTYTPPTESKAGAYTVGTDGSVTYSIATFSAATNSDGSIATDPSTGEVLTTITELETVTDATTAQYVHTTRTDIDPNDYIGLVGNTGDHFGQAVAAVDIDGDGIKDLIVGAPEANDGGLRAGSVYVLLGGETFESKAGDLDVSKAGFVIQGAYSGGNFGAFLDSAGDFNGDGIEDLVVGSPGTQPFGGTGNGELRLIWGDTDIAGAMVKTRWLEVETDVHLPGAVDAIGEEVVLGMAQRAVRETLDSESKETTDVVERDIFDTQKMTVSQGVVFVGRDGAALSGWQSLGALDLNADGLDDLVVGAPFGRGGPSSNGEAYVIYGMDSLGEAMRRFKKFDALEYMAKTGRNPEDVGGFMDIAFGLEGMLPDLSGMGALTFVARPGTDDEAPMSVSGTVTATDHPDFPKPTEAAPVNYSYRFSLTSGQDADVLKITLASTDKAGETAMITEINGVMQGAAGIDLPEGVTYEAITGDSGGFRLIKAGTDTDDAAVGVTVLETSAEQNVFDLSGDLDEDAGFVVRSSEGNSNLGFRLSAAGDVNGDGLQDFIVGARRAENDLGDVTGKAYLIYGMAGGMYGEDVEYAVRKISVYDVIFAEDSNYQTFEGAMLLSSEVVTYADADSAAAAGATYSYVSLTEDTVSTTRLDLTIVEALADVTQSVLNLDDLPATAGFNIESAFGPGAVLGSSVSSAGDINGDGFDDLLVAATGGTAFDINAPAMADDALEIGVGVGSGLVQVIYGRAAFGGVSTTGGMVAVDSMAADAPLVGSAGDDVLTGGMESTAFYAGNGDDMIELENADFVRVDGGYGDDTLLFGMGDDFDFTTNRTGVRSIETLVLDGGEVTLDVQTVYAITEQRTDNKAVLAVSGSGMLNLADFEEETSGSWELGNAVVEVTGSVVVDAG